MPVIALTVAVRGVVTAFASELEDVGGFVSATAVPVRDLPGRKIGLSGDRGGVGALAGLAAGSGRDRRGLCSGVSLVADEPFPKQPPVDSLPPISLMGEH